MSDTSGPIIKQEFNASTVDVFGVAVERTASIDTFIKNTVTKLHGTFSAGLRSPAPPSASRFVSGRAAGSFTDTFNQLHKEMISGFSDSQSVATVAVKSDLISKHLDSDPVTPGIQDDGNQTFLGGIIDFINAPFSLLGFSHKVRTFSLNYLDLYHSIASRNWADVSLVRDVDGGNAIPAYMTDLFLGRFRDRNGQKIAFDLPVTKLDIAQLATLPTSVAPKAAGEIISALAEALGDAVFKVHFYDASILTTHRAQAKAKADSTDFENKVTSKLTDIANLPLTTVKPNIPILANKDHRKALRELTSLETQWDTAADTLKKANEAIRAYDSKKSESRMSFTCVRSNLIPDNLQGIFFNNSTTGVIGNVTLQPKIAPQLPDLSTYDFSDLIGSVIACAANNSQNGVKSIVGGVIRGLAIAGLNNEVVAEVVGALFGGIAKKVAEKFAYTFISDLITRTDTGITEDERKAILFALILLYTNHLIPTTS